MPRPPMEYDSASIPTIKDPIHRLLAIMALLRDPEKGCPWDLKQNLQSLKPYLVEETYEALEAIDNGNPEKHCEELGDVLLQLVFQSQITSETDDFDFYDVAEAIATKLIRRHPHVFAASTADSPEEVLAIWEESKKNEGATGLLDGIPRQLPALQKAERMSTRAARVGFDWPDLSGLLDKVTEEALALTEAQTLEEQEQELGDLLFAIANLGRRLKLDPEEALQKANARFQSRFSHIEARGREQDRPLQDDTLDEVENLWQEAKAIERATPERD